MMYADRCLFVCYLLMQILRVYNALQAKGSSRWLSLVALMGAGLVWSVSLGVMGLWMIYEDHQGALSSGMVSVSAGVAALCAGQIVFLMCIADRLFPNAHRFLVRGLEGVLGAIFFVSILVLAVGSIMSASAI